MLRAVVDPRSQRTETFFKGPFEERSGADAALKEIGGEYHDIRALAAAATRAFQIVHIPENWVEYTPPKNQHADAPWVIREDRDGNKMVFYMDRDFPRTG